MGAQMPGKNKVKLIRVTICMVTISMIIYELVSGIFFSQDVNIPVIIGIGCGVLLFFEQGRAG